MAPEFTLAIHDSIQDERFRIVVQGALTVGELIKTVVEERGLPKTNFLSETLEYELVHLRTGEVLSPPSTFAQIAPRSDDILELRSNEGSLVQDLIEELLDEIRDELIENAVEDAWEKLKRIDSTGAKAKKIEEARHKIQEAAAHGPAPSGGKGAGGQMPVSADRPELYSAQSNVPPRPKKSGPGCLLIGLFVVGLAAVLGFGLLLLIVLPPLLSGPYTPEVIEPTEFIFTEEPAEPTEFVPETCTENYGRVRDARLDFEANEAVFVFVNQGACDWQPETYGLVFVEGDIIQPMVPLPRTVSPGEAIEIRMPVPPEYYEDRRTSVYMLSGPIGPFDDAAVIEFVPID